MFFGGKKGNNQPIIELKAEYEKQYNKAKKVEYKLSYTILAFNLIETCKLKAVMDCFL